MKFPFFDAPVSNAFCHYQIDAERGLRIEVYEGDVELQDWRAMFRTMASDPMWSNARNGLIDLRTANLLLTANEILRLALMQRQDAFYTNGWLVYVVSSSADYGVIRMLGKWSRTTEQSRIFLSRMEAENWLEGHGFANPPLSIQARFPKWQPKPAVAPLRKIG